MLFEVVVGVVAHSLALLSDAAHMFTDAAAIGLSIVAIRLAARPARGVMTYGLKRVEILSAQANGVTLLVLGLLIVVEAIRRLVSPPDVQGGLVLVVALVGIVVNLLAVLVLAYANLQSLNVEGSFQHRLTDLYAFIATAIAGAIIWQTGFLRADGIASLLVAALMLRSSYGLLRESGRAFLEATPRGLETRSGSAPRSPSNPASPRSTTSTSEITSGYPALTAHVIVRRDCDCHAHRLRLATLLDEHTESATQPFKSNTRHASHRSRSNSAPSGERIGWFTPSFRRTAHRVADRLDQGARRRRPFATPATALGATFHE